MEASEIRQFSVDELKGRIRQWREDLFRSKFKTQTAEARDTSILKKLRRDIARGETILREKLKGGGVETPAPAKAKAAPVEAPAEKKTTKRAAAKVEDKPVSEKAPKKTKKKTAKEE